MATESFLPRGLQARDVKIGDTLELGDEESLAIRYGVVSYSQTKEALAYRIVTESGASLVCSHTAPIPTMEKGIRTPKELLGEKIAVRRDRDSETTIGWDTVTQVTEVGTIRVQHITVGNKSFWAGERNGTYILHHNVKDAGGGGVAGDDDPWSWNLRVAQTDAAASHNAALTLKEEYSIMLVGSSHLPVIDGLY